MNDETKQKLGANSKVKEMSQEVIRLQEQLEEEDEARKNLQKQLAQAQQQVHLAQPAVIACMQSVHSLWWWDCVLPY